MAFDCPGGSVKSCVKALAAGATLSGEEVRLTEICGSSNSQPITKNPARPALPCERSWVVRQPCVGHLLPLWPLATGSSVLTGFLRISDVDPPSSCSMGWLR